MNNFKDKLIAISKSRNEENFKLAEKEKNEELDQTIKVAIDYLSWLNNNYQSELEIFANEGHHSWSNGIFGNNTSFIRSLYADKFEKRIRESIEFKNLEEKFHKSGLVLNLSRQRINNLLLFKLDTNWNI